MGVIEMRNASHVREYMGATESRIQLENPFKIAVLGLRDPGSQIYTMEHPYGAGRKIHVASGVFHPEVLRRFEGRVTEVLRGEIDFIDFMRRLDIDGLNEGIYTWAMTGNKHGIPLRLSYELYYGDDLVPGTEVVITRPNDLPVIPRTLRGGAAHG